ncbi:hypothetical protein PR048_003021 [Dryococelus australis]|uniref:Uncharacterized protein n=1 Tax=Dryococelus australis TaxID=614101 RepID=A0ABQ9ILY2_9NEOP|nr:hypothetical protein PR048_003021 [Dryococelus australis]
MSALMSGTVKEVQTLITEKQPKAQYYDCTIHSLNFALQDCWVQEIGNVVKGSPKKFSELDLEETSDAKQLCPHIGQPEYDILPISEDVASKVCCLYTQFSKEMYLGLRICLELFSETGCLNVGLQKKTMTVAGDSEAINFVLKCLREKRNEDGFNHRAKRLEQSNYAAPEELYCNVFFEALDSITGEIKRRLEQTGSKMYAYLEEALATQPIE